MMLSVKDLHARIGEKEILKGINLEVRAGEVHAIMGPNGSGKSTLGNVILQLPNNNPQEVLSADDFFVNKESYVPHGAQYITKESKLENI